ncbi:MAG: hypothetical protein B7Z51_03995 [Methyloversatilis sp. 12-65-5]|nr:MAG: hypothetical protein B7Z51_03995 [Methyloversatilis sp. 12-65-5]
MCAMRLTGYADKFGVHPGDTIRFYVNCDGPAKYEASVVQMINYYRFSGPGTFSPAMRQPAFANIRDEDKLSSLRCRGIIGTMPARQLRHPGQKPRMTGD